MTSFYHGSYVRYVIGGLGLWLRRRTKAMRKLVAGSSPTQPLFLSSRQGRRLDRG